LVMERSAVQFRLAVPPSIQNPGSVDRRHHARADAHFYFASGTLFDISVNRLDGVGFPRRQRRLPDGNLRRKMLPAARAPEAGIKASFRFD
jgi:hypothetical protein